MLFKNVILYLSFIIQVTVQVDFNIDKEVNSLVKKFNLPTSPLFKFLLKKKFLKRKKAATSKTITKLRTSTVEEVKEGAVFASVGPCDLNLLKEWKCKSCLQAPNNVFVDSFYNHETEVFALLVKDEIETTFRLIFRATTTAINEEHNQNTILIPYDSNSQAIKVHTGYKTSIDSVSHKIVSKLKDLYKQEQYKGYKMKIYGHSLGGALASLAVLKIQSELELNEGKLYLFTYGQPRVGNYDFVRFFNSHKFHSSRVVNYHDEITHFPAYVTEDYIHFNNEIFIDKDNSVIQCNSSYFEDSECSQKVPIADLSKESHGTYFIDLRPRSVC
ncbi:alpha/beta-hydrolase [Neoconidiobolus thromboides FSU 785]|nr:alpha/beta-hydrolase [Neoconidiobolus thromboides FSU 785]